MATSALAAVAVVLGADTVIATSPPLPVLALTDWAGHLATTHLLLAAALGPDYRRARPGWAAAALAATVAVDVDHVPQYLARYAWPRLTRQSRAPRAPGHRPSSHGLLGLGLLAAVAARTRRPRLRAATVGVGLHLVRDLATGPGLRLLWPLSGRGSRAPYPPYAAMVLAAAAVASRRSGPALAD